MKKETIAINKIIDNSPYEDLEESYDFSHAMKNPFVGKVKKQITIRLTESTLNYYKNLGEKFNMPYQTLINMYLTECAEKRLEPVTTWKSRKTNYSK